MTSKQVSDVTVEGEKQTRGKRKFGTVRQLKSGNWQARYLHHGRWFKARDTFTRKDYATAWLRDEERLIALDAWSPPEERWAAKQRALRKDEGPTLAEWFERFLAERLGQDEGAMQRTTLDKYRQDWRTRIHTLGDVPVSKLDKDAVAVWWAGLGTKFPSARWHAYATLRTVMNAAVEAGLAESNPCVLKGVRKPRVKHKAQALTPAELLTYLSAVDDRYRLPLAIAGLCGLRSGEVRALRRCDVDVEGRTVYVRRSVARVNCDDRVGQPGHKREWLFKDPKSEAGIREVALPMFLVPLLKEHLAALTMRGREQLLFPAMDGRSPLHTTVLAENHEKGLAAIGRSEVWVHDLRKTAATMAAQGGATVRELMVMLGHTTPDVALLYQVAQKERDRQRADRLDEVLRDAV